MSQTVSVKVTIEAEIEIDAEDLMHEGIEDHVEGLDIQDLVGWGDITIEVV